MEQVFDADKLTDIEIAMNLLRLMADNDLQRLNKARKYPNIAGTYIRMAENAVKTLSNPFARKLLLDKIAEQTYC